MGREKPNCARQSSIAFHFYSHCIIAHVQSQQFMDSIVTQQTNDIIYCEHKKAAFVNMRVNIIERLLTYNKFRALNIVCVHDTCRFNFK